MAGDVFSTGCFIADLAEVAPDSVVAVLGCGPVGLMAVLGARERGATRIFSIDCIPERLKLAEKFGATPVHFQEENPLDTLKSATGGRGADCALELVGNAVATGMAVDLLRPGGGLAVGGVNTDNFGFRPSHVYDKNLTVRSGRCPARHYMDRTMPLIRDRKYDLAAIVSHRMPLSAGVEGYAMFNGKKDGCTKVLISPSSAGS